MVAGSKRIQEIASFYSDEEVVWDTCCDHGLIGESLLNQNCEQIFFIDIVPAIINKLKNRLTHPKANFLCLDAGKIKLIPQKRNLVIISGIGGEGIISILKSLLESIKNQTHFILVAHRDTLKMRAYLDQMTFGLMDETVVEDKKKYYEILKVCYPYNHGVSSKISPYGNKMWQSPKKDVDLYLDHLIGHYQKLGQHADNVEILPFLLAQRLARQKPTHSGVK